MHYGHSFKFFDKPVNFCETIQLMLTQSSCNPNQAWEGKGGEGGGGGGGSWKILQNELGERVGINGDYIFVYFDPND